MSVLLIFSYIKRVCTKLKVHRLKLQLLLEATWAQTFRSIQQRKVRMATMIVENAQATAVLRRSLNDAAHMGQ